MSYILDALRKSEQERQRGKVPDLNSYKEEAVAETSSRNIWPWITGALVIVSVTVIAVVWAPNRHAVNLTPAVAQPVPQAVTPQTQATVEAPPRTPAVATAPAPRQEPIPQAAPIPQSHSAPKPQPVNAAPRREPPPTDFVVEDTQPPVAEEPALVSPQQPEPDFSYQDSTPNVAYMPQLEELPTYQRSKIPDMTFSSHMYSSIPRFRSIIINGKRLKEGDFLDQNLQVREITEKGVIMSNGSVLFTVDVLGRWAQ